MTIHYISAGHSERVTPVSAEHSATYNNQPAALSVDKDNTTWSQTDRIAGGGTWIKFELKKVNFMITLTPIASTIPSTPFHKGF